MMKLTVKQFSDIQTAIQVRDCVQETRQNLYLLSTICKSKYRRSLVEMIDSILKVEKDVISDLEYLVDWNGMHEYIGENYD